MAEEHWFQAPEGHLCLNKSPAGSPLLSPRTAAAAPSPVAEEQPSTSPERAASQPQQAPSRCSECRKKVGLTGFRCRCGTTFCGAHRYPESHGCCFDYKAVGREAIAVANPVVKAVKLERI